MLVDRMKAIDALKAKEETNPQSESYSLDGIASSLCCCEFPWEECGVDQER